MRLVRVEISGYRRFNHTSGTSRLEVDGPLIAIVGPNEAGKTSLLRALCRLDDDSPIESRDRTRLGGIPDSHEVLEAMYLIEPMDRDALPDLHGADDPLRTRWFVLSKYADGSRATQIIPGLRRDRSRRREAERTLRRLTRHPKWPTDHSDDSVLSPDRIVEILEMLASDDETIPDGKLSPVRELIVELSPLRVGDHPVAPEAETAAQAAQAFLDEETRPHPDDLARERLGERRPRFLMLDEDQMDLRTDYELAQVATDTPAALDNLVRLAELDLEFLQNLISDGDSGTAVDVLNAANERLKAAFEAWSQVPTTVRLDREGDALLRVHVSRTAGGFDRLDDRSDGLRMFVSLIAITAGFDYAVPPIVLIDELERHLHYDAQADVVQLFTRQRELPQIVYTTHSAGCLPEDLGAGIRIVRQSSGSNLSEILNRFWTTRGEQASVGFSPLLFGMGASTLAFVPVRRAVMTEGATDLVLLPTLIREATGDKHVGFQVAPASSEAPTAHVAGLNREAVHVAWLVDGDTAGGEIARAVRRELGAGRLATLGGGRSGKVLEDLLLPSVYAKAVNAQLARSGVEAEITDEVLSGVNRPRRVAEWCRMHDVAAPNKMDVANRVLDLQHDVPALLNADGVRTLKELQTAILTILGQELGDDEESLNDADDEST